jgi:hypothetical protein
VIDFAFFCGKETQNREIFANSAFRIKIIGRESTNGKGMHKQGAKRQQLVPPHPVVLVFILSP